MGPISNIGPKTSRAARDTPELNPRKQTIRHDIAGRRPPPQNRAAAAHRRDMRDARPRATSRFQRRALCATSSPQHYTFHNIELVMFTLKLKAKPQNPENWIQSSRYEEFTAQSTARNSAASRYLSSSTQPPRLIGKERPSQEVSNATKNSQNRGRKQRQMAIESDGEQ
ncbi:hypothetical protein F511_15008 [Dorcoceras hygrometricum]|uniref:Uncharacterized protein n=1 Tax=Dorcoceras hygrometricum TaxID=472368 RepID=A0A2Z7DEI1_9LAMI|nr:hypothetical protein F511_15008 [Dorcoceras hygrometricum]